MIRARDVIPDGILSVQQMIREMQRFLTESIKNGMEKERLYAFGEKAALPVLFLLVIPVSEYTASASFWATMSFPIKK